MATAIEAPADAAGAQVLHTPFRFAPAVKDARPARITLDGPPGSGRTLTALRIAAGLGGRIALIETEHGSAAQWSDQIAFDTIELGEFTGEALRLALFSAGWAGYDTVIVDCYSAFWSGRGGLLEQVDAATVAAGRGATASAGWSAVRPAERAVTEALMSYPGHVIMTLRCRTETVQTDDGTGRMVPVRVAGKTEQRDGLEYDVDLAATLLPDHTLVVTKSRIPQLDRQILPDPGQDLGVTVAAWAAQGTARAPQPGYYQEAYRPDATLESLTGLLRTLEADRALGMPAMAPDGSATTLGAVVEFRRRAAEQAARRAAHGRGVRETRYAAGRQQAQAGIAPGPRPAPAPAETASVRLPGSDGPVAPPEPIDAEDPDDGQVQALAFLIDRLRDERAWGDLPTVLRALVDAQAAELLDVSVFCVDGRHRELRHLLDDRIHELKQKNNTRTTLAGAA